MSIPKNLKYTKEHEWALLSADSVTIGITDHAQNSLGDLVFVELPTSGDSITKGETFGVVESIKAVSDLYAPVTGEVVEVNQEAIDNPSSLNENPYDSGWLLKVKITETDQLNDLMSADDYEAFVSSLS